MCALERGRIARHEDAKELRNFGVNLVGSVPWGTHLCQFYETKQDLVDILVPYFAEGLRSNEFCMWVTSLPLEVIEAKEALRKVVPELDTYVAKGQIEIISYNEWYLLGGKFDCNRVLLSWVEKETAALKRGFEGLRLTGNTLWIERNLWQSFVDYEEAINAVIGEHKMLALCTYCLKNCSGTDVMDVVRNHVGTLIKQGEKWSLVEDVAQRKKAEQELWRAKNDWERTFDSDPDLIAILDNNHRIVRANRAMAQTLGVKPEQAIGLACYTCVHGTNAPPDFCPHSKSIADGKEHIAEVHEPRLGGDFLVSTTPLRDEQGRMVGSVHVARNITERKKAEQALAKLNRHLRAISNSNQALMYANNEKEFTQEVCNIIVHDCGYALVWVGFAQQNKQKTVLPVAYAGFDKEYIDHLNITWADAPRGRGPTGTVIRTGKPYVCRNMQSDPNFEPWREQAAKRKYTASLVLPLSSFGGKTFGALNIYSREPDPFSDEEIKLLTELANDFAYGIEMLRLRREREQAADQARKQAALIDLSPDAIMIRQLDGNITFWSKGAEKLYGYTKEEAIGQTSNRILQTIFPEPLKEIILQLKHKGHWSGELIHQTKDERKVIVQSYWLAKLDEHGEVAEMMESNVDITDRKQMQNKLEEYAAHLEELVEERTQQLKNAERLTAIGETAGMVGHDLRNPLQTVTGETYLAKSELQQLPDSPEKRNLEESIQTIAEQISYMDKIVSDLQDFVRPITPEKKHVNLQKLIRATMTEVITPENVEVQTQIDQNIPEVPADAQLLKRVFFNLLNNALQAMPKGGKLKVKMQNRKNPKGEDKVLISFEDTGVGIPEEVKPKIFKPLFTTKSKGQGFGLVVCKRVIEAHGGTIGFESEEGKGTKFTVELPIENTNAN